MRCMVFPPLQEGDFVLFECDIDQSQVVVSGEGWSMM